MNPQTLKLQSAAPFVPAADRPINLLINDAVPSATRIEPGNLFLWNWQKMQEYARTCVEADRASVTFAPKPEAQQAVGEMDRTAPPKVWLQIDADGNSEDRSQAVPHDAWDDLTWCAESIGGQEVAYIRHDLAHPLPVADAREPRPMETAPRDGTLVRLLVEFTEHDVEDAAGPHWTIGAWPGEGDDSSDWRFAGWCWTHDHFTEGKGRPLGWLPFAIDAARKSTEGRDHG